MAPSPSDRARGIATLAIGVSLNGSDDELRCVASAPELAVPTADFDSLPGVEAAIVQAACDIRSGEE